MDTIHVYVGSSPNGEDAESLLVLEHSLRTNTSGPVEIHWMQLSHDPTSPWFSDGQSGGWNTLQWPTPFSGFRWGIPWAAKYEGKAIYMDSDMIIQTDLRELWDLPIGNKLVAAKSLDRFCVCLWNNKVYGELVERGRLPNPEKARLDPNYHNRMKNIFYGNPHLVHIFDPMWNNFDGQDRPIEDAKILHYTDMSSQVHQKYAVPRLKAAGQKHWFDGDTRAHWRDDVQALFDFWYNKALAEGRTVDQYIPENPYGDYRKLSQVGYRANHGYDPPHK
jgi:hypothetical protein